ncbi:Cap15 family cyclic dinucleotide receptor domain-containing protein [Yersinia enterocolitica]
MRNVTFKNSLYLLVAFSAVAWFSLAYVNELDLSKIKDFLGLIPKVVSIDLLMVAVFAKWGWKLKIFRGWLVPFPNLSGSWVGFIYSDWKNPQTGEKPPPIPVMLTVNQSFFHISCMMRTSEMESSSYSEGFLIDPERQIKDVAYSYASKPRLSLNERSIPHDGTVVFKIIENPKLKLVGRYWTERLTKGEIVLQYHSKEMLEELPENLGEHPVTENENRR